MHRAFNFFLISIIEELSQPTINMQTKYWYQHFWLWRPQSLTHTVVNGTHFNWQVPWWRWEDCDWGNGLSALIRGRRGSPVHPDGLERDAAVKVQAFRMWSRSGWKKGIKKLFYFDQNNVNFNIFWYEKKVASRNRF